MSAYKDSTIPSISYLDQRTARVADWLSRLAHQEEAVSRIAAVMTRSSKRNIDASTDSVNPSSFNVGEEEHEDKTAIPNETISSNDANNNDTNSEHPANDPQAGEGLRRQ